MKKKFKNIRNEHLKSIYKDTNFILPLKRPKNLCRGLASSRFISNQELINAVIKDAKYVKII